MASFVPAVVVGCVARSWQHGRLTAGALGERDDGMATAGVELASRRDWCECPLE